MLPHRASPWAQIWASLRGKDYWEEAVLALIRSLGVYPPSSIVELNDPRNSSWITKVRASSWRTWQNTKMSHYHRGDHDFLYFAMHTNILHVFFAPNCRF